VSLALRRLAIALAVIATLVVARRAEAQQDRRTEASAREAIRKAHADYHAEDYDTAIIRLKKALTACGTIRCSATLRSALTRDIGVMQFKRGDSEGAAASFAQSRKLDSSLEMSSAYDTDDVLEAWQAAKRGARPPPKKTAPTSPSETPAESPSETPAAAAPEVESAHEYARVWIGVAGAIDVQFLPSATDACALTSAALPFNSAGYYCTNPNDGSDFPSRVDPAENATLTPGHAGNASGGPAWGAVRVMATIDVAVSPHALIGARLGYVANAYKGDAAKTDGRAFGPPLHVELRGTYLFTEDPLARSGFAPLVMVGLGAAQFGASTDVTLTQTGIPGQRIKQAWKPGGPWFAAVGGGIRYALSQRAGFTAILKLETAFGANGMIPALSPEVGLQYGF
jgi:hypothetical protein